MGARFRFTDVWTVPASVERSWAALSHPDWPSWWPDYRRIELVREGNPDGTGWVGRARVRSNLPYTLDLTLEIVEVDAPRYVRTRVDGFFRGDVSWTLEPWTDGAGTPGTRLTLHEDVETTWPLINLLTRLGARRLFEANHRAAMRRGEAGFRRLVAARFPA